MSCYDLQLTKEHVVVTQSCSTLSVILPQLLTAESLRMLCCGGYRQQGINLEALADALPAPNLHHIHF